MKDRQVKVGAMLSYAQMALNVVVGLVYTPLMIRLLGQNEYGLYNTVASTISMLSILNLGFGSGYIRYFAKYKANKDTDSINKLNGLFLMVFLIIGSIALMCGLYLTYNLELVFDKGLTLAEYRTAKILMLLFTVNLTISFPMSVFANIISANERFIFLKLLGMMKTVGSPLLTIPLLLMGKGSVAVVAVTLLISLLVDTVYLYYVFRVLHNRFVFRDFEKGIFKSLFAYTVFIALNVIIDQINWNVDRVILGRYRGTASVAVYSVGATLQTYYQMFSTSISGIFGPRIHHIVNSGKSAAERSRVLTSLFIKIGRIQYLVLALVCSGLIFFGREFIYFWAGPGYDEAYIVALLLIIPVTIPLIQNLGIEIQRAQNQHQFRSVAYALMAVVNLILSIFLVQRYGAPGAAFGTTLALILANGLIMNIYYQKKCGINVVQFWKNIGRMSLGLVVPCVYGCLIKRFFDFYSIMALGAGILTYMLVYALSMWFFGINREEKGMVHTVLSKLGIAGRK